MSKSTAPMDIAIGEDEFPVILLYDDMKVMYFQSTKRLFCPLFVIDRTRNLKGKGQ